MVKLAIIGTGGIAQKAYFPLLAVMPHIEIVAVHSKTMERAIAAGARWRIPFATDSIGAIIQKKPDAAIVLSSTESHFAICKELLENGIDVYSEKSLTDESDLSLELDRVAKKEKRILLVGYNRRYSLLYRQAKEFLGGRNVRLAIIQKHRTSASCRSLQEQYLDDTIHQIDLMRFFCGDATAEGTTYQMEKDVLISSVSTVRLHEGGQGIITICNQAGAWQESATLHTDDFSIHVDAFRILRVIYNDHEERFGTDRAGNWITSMKERGFYGEMEHFLNCVQTRSNPETGAFEAAKTQQLMEELVRASGDEYQSKS